MQCSERTCRIFLLPQVSALDRPGLQILKIEWACSRREADVTEPYGHHSYLMHLQPFPELGKDSREPKRFFATRVHRMGSPGRGQQFEGSNASGGGGFLRPASQTF